MEGEESTWIVFLKLRMDLEPVDKEGAKVTLFPCNQALSKKGIQIIQGN